MSELLNNIVKTCTKYNAQFELPPNYLVIMAYVESSFNPQARNPSGAAGLFQFVPSTARAMGLSDPYNYVASTLAAAKYSNTNRLYWRTRGVEPAAWQLYLAHQQGPGGAWLITSAAARGSAVSSTIRRNMDANGGRGQTPAQFLERWKKLWDSKSAAAVGVLARAGIVL